MRARDHADRWIEALQILAGPYDNLTDAQREEMRDVRTRMLDACLAEAATTEAYPGELPGLRGLVRGLRVAARKADMPELQRLLLDHAAFDGDARDRMKTQDRPDFFEAGRTYTDGNGYRAPELTTIFLVEHVTRHPDRGHLRAIGWARTGEPGSKWHGDFRDQGEFNGWTELSEEATR